MNVYHKRLYDAELIQDFLTDPELWELISESGQKTEGFVVPINDSIHWVGLYDKDLLFGILVIHATTVTTGIVHINILKQYRSKYSTIAGLNCMDYMLYNTEFNKFNTEVPVIYPNVINYLKRFGFKNEGINRLSINKNNMIVDQKSFGITREELFQTMDDMLSKLRGVN